MKWSLDTHKFVSEIVRTALQVIINRKINAQSGDPEIKAAEKELFDKGVYRTREGADGRIRRALLTYFKAYHFMNPNGDLTDFGKAFYDGVLTVKEACLHFIFYYKYSNAGISYYPLETILSFIKYCEDNEQEARISLEDFDAIVAGDTKSDDYFSTVVSNRGTPRDVDARAVGYDVWGYMLIESGLFYKNDSKQLCLKNRGMAQLLMSAYSDLEEEVTADKLSGGYFKCFTKPTISERSVSRASKVEAKTLCAYIFDGIDAAIIDRYICPQGGSLVDMLKNYGLNESCRAICSDYIGYEHLVGMAWKESTNQHLKELGEKIVSLKAGIVDSDYVADVELEPDAETPSEMQLLERNIEISRITLGMNVLLYGVPGSGKSWTIEHEYVKPASKVERLVFHPDYTYSDFVGQILPCVEEDKPLTYKFTPGPFTNILRDAYQNPQEEYILVIEEINRGNAPAIFGEIFQLLDRKVDDDDSSNSYPVGTSEYGITNANIAQIVYRDPKHKVRIPSNLSIIGTMNTSDQNVFTLDTAFQRRWQMRLIENSFENVDPLFADMPILDTTVTWETFCTEINKIIIGNGVRTTSSEDKRLGVYFVHKSDLDFDDKMGDLKDGTYDALRKKESAQTITEEEKTQLATIRSAMMQNRRFPEKVIKYLWDDAFKFNREAVFDVGAYQSLEDVIRAFLYSSGRDRMNIFSESVRGAIFNTEA